MYFQFLPSFSKEVLIICLCVVTTSHAFLTISSPTTTTTTTRNRHHGSSSSLLVFRDSGSESLSPSSLISKDFVVVGGGPAGLLGSIMLAQKFPQKQVTVYDKLPEPPSPTDDSVWYTDTAKYYLIGLGGRGITALQKFGVWEDVKKVSVNVPGRKDWTPQTPDGAETMLTNRKFTPYILPRDKLVSVLYQHIQQNYGNQITVQCRTEVYPVDFEYQSGSGQGESVVVDIVVDNNHQGVKEERVVAELVLVADGNARTFAQKMEELDPSFEIVRYIDDNPRVYKSVSFRIPGDWRFDLNYSVRSNDGRVNFDALPANEKGDYVGILLVKGDDEMARGNIDPVEYRAFLEEQIPQIVPMLTQSDIELMASKESSTLPRFRYIRPRMHQGKRTILLGDCAKTVKPYFGMGANSALEDVKLFGESIDRCNNDLTKAVLSFSEERSPEIETLVRVSHDLDRPGMEGVFSFLVPIILDGIFSKAAPRLFLPNTITMLQDEEFSFNEVASRKRMDRAGQVLLLSFGGFSMSSMVSSVVDFLT